MTTGNSLGATEDWCSRARPGIRVGVDPLVRDPGPGEELSQPQGLGRERRSDHPDRRRRILEQDGRRAMNAARMVSPSRGLVAISWRRRSRGTAMTSPGSRDSRGNEDPQAGEHVELAEEPARPVAGDRPLVSVDRHDDVDLGGDDDVEVVTEVALTVQVLALGDLTPLAQGRDAVDIGRVELRERFLVDHGWTLPTRHQGPDGRFFLVHGRPGSDCVNPAAHRRTAPTFGRSRPAAPSRPQTWCRHGQVSTWASVIGVEPRPLSHTRVAHPAHSLRPVARTDHLYDSENAGSLTDRGGSPSIYAETGGLRPAHGAACSSWPASESSVSSSPKRPTNCTPIGQARRRSSAAAARSPAGPSR